MDITFPFFTALVSANPGILLSPSTPPRLCRPESKNNTISGFTFASASGVRGLKSSNSVTAFFAPASSMKFETEVEAIKFLNDLGIDMPAGSDEGEIRIDRLH